MITIDIPKAKDIWKDKIRVARKSALEKLDVDYMRANEQGNDTTAIVTDKQTLRDLPRRKSVAENSLRTISQGCEAHQTKEQ